jgi:hypothetical protein
MPKTSKSVNFISHAALALDSLGLGRDCVDGRITASGVERPKGGWVGIKSEPSHSESRIRQHEEMKESGWIENPNSVVH